MKGSKLKLGGFAVILLILGLSYFYIIQPAILEQEHNEELTLAKKVFDRFQENKMADEQSDSRIYAPSFPHYKREYAEFETGNQDLSFIESLNREGEKAKTDPEFKAYSDAVSEQIGKVSTWEFSVEGARADSETLYRLIKLDTKNDSLKMLLSQYADVARDYWKLEEQYFWSQYCYRIQQIENIQDCQMQFKGKFTDNIDEDIKPAAQLMEIMQAKISPYLD